MVLLPCVHWTELAGNQQMIFALREWCPDSRPGEQGKGEREGGQGGEESSGMAVSCSFTSPSLPPSLLPPPPSLPPSLLTVQ